MGASKEAAPLHHVAAPRRDAHLHDIARHGRGEGDEALPAFRREFREEQPPPEMARPMAPKKPEAPAVAMVVLRAMLGVIQDKRSGSATMVSPGPSVT